MLTESAKDILNWYDHRIPQCGNIRIPCYAIFRRPWSKRTKAWFSTFQSHISIIGEKCRLTKVSSEQKFRRQRSLSYFCVSPLQKWRSRPIDETSVAEHWRGWLRWGGRRQTFPGRCSKLNLKRKSPFIEKNEGMPILFRIEAIFRSKTVSEHWTNKLYL